MHLSVELITPLPLVKGNLNIILFITYRKLLLLYSLCSLYHSIRVSSVTRIYNLAKEYTIAVQSDFGVNPVMCTLSKNFLVVHNLNNCGLSVGGKVSVFGDVKPYFTSKQKPSWEIRLLTLLLRVMNNVFTCYKNQM